MRATVLISVPAFILLAVGVAATPSPSDSLTIEEAVHLTLENHPAIRQAKFGLSASEARIGISRSALYPEISFFGGYTRLGPVATIDLNNKNFHLYPADNFDFFLGLDKTLYDWGRTATSIRLARSVRQESEENIGVVEFNLAYQTMVACNAIMILRQNIDVIQEQIDALGGHVEVAQKRVKAGTATDFDVLTTEVRIAAATDQKIEVARALENQEIALRQLTGWPTDRPINLIGEFTAASLLLNPDSLVSAADAQRPEMRIAREAENVAAVESQLSALGRKPLLAMNITTGFKNGYVPDLNRLKGNYTAGLMLQVPLYDGHRTRHQEDEARADLNSARAHTSDLRLQIIAEVQQAIAGVNSSRDKIDNAELQLKQAEQALAMARTRYEAGVITNLDLLDAETALAQAKLIRLKALYDYTVSLVALSRATGNKRW